MDEELKRLLESTAAETRRHFDVIAERLETRLDGLSEAVTIVDEKIDRKTAVIEERMERGGTEHRR